MHQRIRRAVALGAATILLAATAAVGQLGDNCQSKKLDAAGAYGRCRLHAEARGLRLGRDPELSSCDDAFQRQWDRAERRAGGSCPNTGDLDSMQGAIADYTDVVVSGLDGLGLVPQCPALPVTGQIIEYQPGDDGDIQAGAPFAYHDNGDGTITDITTKLVWEKKVARDDQPVGLNLHDADNSYPWSGRCTNAGNFNAPCFQDSECPAGESCVVKDGQKTNLTIWGFVDALNALNFANHNDWRVPNVKELQTLRNFANYDPAVNPPFNSPTCGAACGDVTKPECSCAIANLTWTSTTYAKDLGRAWNVTGNFGEMTHGSKDSQFAVRAVRGGR